MKILTHETSADMPPPPPSRPHRLPMAESQQLRKSTNAFGAAHRRSVEAAARSEAARYARAR
jgi:hypothetical protein